MPLFMRLYNRFLAIAPRLSPAVLLVVRVFMARVFFLSGLVKISDVANTIALFRDEYQVPFIPPVFAAYASMLFELSCPVLLVLGLATRFATLPLLAMAMVIRFTYDPSMEPVYWALLLVVLLAHGAGPWSVDALVKRKASPAR